MSFAGLPLSLVTAAAGAAGVAIALLHLVRSRRPVVRVAFVPLVRQAITRQPRVLHGLPLRRLLSLLLTLTVLACIVVAAADPQVGKEASARTLVLLLDASASMQVRDEVDDAGRAITRFERARTLCERLIEQLNAGDRVLVVRLDAQPVAVGGFTGERAEALRQLRAVEVGAEVADAASGLALAGQLAKGQPGPTAVLVTDGALPHGLHAPAGVAVRALLVGRRGDDDVGLSVFAARRQPSHPHDCEVLVELRSRRARATDVELEIFAGGELVHVERIAVAPGARVRRVLTDLAARGTRLSARLVPPVGADGGSRAGGSPLDAWPLDDVAFAVLPPWQAARVLLVTDGNLFLEGALLADEGVQLTERPPAAWDEREAARHDLVVLDGYTPPRPPPVPALYIDPHGPGSPFPIRGTLRDPLVTATAHHPLTRFLGLSDLNVSVASRLGVTPGDLELVSSLSDPLYLAREGRPRVAALAFDLRRSDLPLRVGFPVLVTNAVEWLRGEQGAGAAADPARVGEASEVAWPAKGGAEFVVVESPGGERVEAVVSAGRLRYTPHEPGHFRVALPDGTTRLLAVNVDPTEPLEPAPALRVGGQPVAPPDAPAARARQAPWRVLLLTAIALLLVEWWAFHRRVTA